MRRALWMTLVLLSGCDLVGTGPASGGSLDCDAVGTHIEDLCGLFAAEWAEKTRHDCETFGMSASDRRCVLRSTSCEDDTLGACNVHDRTWGCSSDDSECPPGLMCRVDSVDSVCVACFDDGDCESGRFCLSGWCLDDTPDHRQLQNLTDPP